jgi:hypothetical protein
MRYRARVEGKRHAAVARARDVRARNVSRNG